MLSASANGALERRRASAVAIIAPRGHAAGPLGIIMNLSARFLGVALLAVLGLSSCSQSPSYLSFIGRGSAYYARIAEACEAVRTNTPSGLATGQKISTDRLALPAALLELHPDYLRISSDRVFMSFGVGRGAYGVAWESTGGSSWELRTYAEGLERVMFTKQSK